MYANQQMHLLHFTFYVSLAPGGRSFILRLHVDLWFPFERSFIIYDPRTLKMLGIFQPVLALTYINFIEYLSARALPRAQLTTLSFSRSILFPTSSSCPGSSTLSLICLIHFSTQFSIVPIFSKDVQSVIEYASITPQAPRQQVCARVLYLYWPAVSQI